MSTSVCKCMSESSKASLFFGVTPIVVSDALPCSNSSASPVPLATILLRCSSNVWRARSSRFVSNAAHFRLSSSPRHQKPTRSCNCQRQAAAAAAGGSARGTGRSLLVRLDLHTCTESACRPDLTGGTSPAVLSEDRSRSLPALASRACHRRISPDRTPTCSNQGPSQSSSPSEKARSAYPVPT